MFKTFDALSKGKRLVICVAGIAAGIALILVNTNPNDVFQQEDIITTVRVMVGIAMVGLYLVVLIVRVLDPSPPRQKFTEADFAHPAMVVRPDPVHVLATVLAQLVAEHKLNVGLAAIIIRVFKEAWEQH